VPQEIVRLTSEEEFGVQLVDPRTAGGGKVAPERQWSEMVIGECEVSPKGARDDLVDTVMQALWFLRKSGEAQLGAERKGEGRHRLRPPSDRQSEPIYDV
jgi:hypothetical protein